MVGGLDPNTVELLPVSSLLHRLVSVRRVHARLRLEALNDRLAVARGSEDTVREVASALRQASGQQPPGRRGVGALRSMLEGSE